MARAADEARHTPDAGVWEERWWFDYVANDGEGPWGGYVRLAFRPFDGVGWYWTAVVGAAPHPLVMFRAHDVPIPRTGTEIRTQGIWAALNCETRGQHWSAGLECFGVALDDPLDAWADERGHLVPLGLDLEWEATGPLVPYANHAYDQWCEVHGEVLIGDHRLPVDGFGSREHAWGSPETPPQSRVADPGQAVIHGRDAPAVDARGLPRQRLVSPVLVPDARVAHALVDGAGWSSWWW